MILLGYILFRVFVLFFLILYLVQIPKGTVRVSVQRMTNDRVAVAENDKKISFGG